MVYVEQLVVYKTMKSSKWHRIKDTDKYTLRIKEGYFRKYQRDVDKYRNKNFISKWLNNYKYKLKVVTYKNPEWIKIKYQVPFTEGLARYTASQLGYG